MVHTVYTVVTPLPATLTRATVTDYLHSHSLMIDLNPLVESHRRIPRAPARATAEEYAYAAWYEVVDRISYLPRGMYTGKVTYHVCFHDLPDGVQTRCYAPLGLDIREKWTVGGSEAGEVRRNQEIGIGVPRDGLYLREDVDMRCGALVVGFVKRNLRNSHGKLVDRLIARAGRDEAERYNERLMTAGAGSSLGSVEGVLPASVGSRYSTVSSPPYPHAGSPVHAGFDPSAGSDASTIGIALPYSPPPPPQQQQQQQQQQQHPGMGSPPGSFHGYTTPSNTSSYFSKHDSLASGGTPPPLGMPELPLKNPARGGGGAGGWGGEGGAGQGLDGGVYGGAGQGLDGAVYGGGQQQQQQQQQTSMEYVQRLQQGVQSGGVGGEKELGYGHAHGHGQGLAELDGDRQIAELAG